MSSEWQDGDSLTFFITGTGSRYAHSFNSDPCFAPRLIIEYDSSCQENGLTRACRGDQGNGTQACARRQWQQCQLTVCEEGRQVRGNRCVPCGPGDLRACDGDHGTGTQMCEDNDWGPCEETQCDEGYEVVQNICQVRVGGGWGGVGGGGREKKQTKNQTAKKHLAKRKSAEVPHTHTHNTSSSRYSGTSPTRRTFWRGTTSPGASTTGWR